MHYDATLLTLEERNEQPKWVTCTDFFKHKAHNAKPFTPTSEFVYEKLREESYDQMLHRLRLYTEKGEI